MAGISAKLPLTYDSVDGAYALNKTILDTVRQNLKMLLLTNPGERVGDPRFGIGIKKSLFQQKSEEEYNLIRININEQTRIYMPFLQITRVDFAAVEQNSNLDENEINVRIQYNLPAYSSTDILSINISIN